MNIVVVGQGYVGLPAGHAGGRGRLPRGRLRLDDDRVSRLNARRVLRRGRPRRAAAGALATGRYRHRPSDGLRAGLRRRGHHRAHAAHASGAPDLSFIESAASHAGPLPAPRRDRDPRVHDLPGHHRGAGRSRSSRRGPACRPGDDFHVGYSPERIDPGNTTWTFVNTPKVVSGIDAASLAAVAGLLRHASSSAVVPVSGTAEAELTKLLENTFRHVNIALVNELAMFAADLDIDIWEAIDAASSKPFGFMRFTPAPASAGTACRSTRATCRGGCERSLGRQLPLRRAGQRRQRAHARLRGPPAAAGLNRAGRGA